MASIHLSQRWNTLSWLAEVVVVVLMLVLAIMEAVVVRVAYCQRLALLWLLVLL